VSKHKKKKRPYEPDEKAMQAFTFTFKNIADAIADNLRKDVADFPQGFSVKYEINNLKALAPMFGTLGMPKTSLLLWHGTSFSRANSILKSGFFGRVFFSSNAMMSLGYAERRAFSDSSEPALFGAVYALKDKGFHRHGNDVFSFPSATATEIVRCLLVCYGLYPALLINILDIFVNPGFRKKRWLLYLLRGG